MVTNFLSTFYSSYFYCCSLIAFWWEVCWTATSWTFFQSRLTEWLRVAEWHHHWTHQNHQGLPWKNKLLSRRIFPGLKEKTPPDNSDQVVNSVDIDRIGDPCQALLFCHSTSHSLFQNRKMIEVLAQNRSIPSSHRDCKEHLYLVRILSQN